MSEKVIIAEELNKQIMDVMKKLTGNYPDWVEYKNMQDKLSWISQELLKIQHAEIKGKENESENN